MMKYFKQILLLSAYMLFNVGMAQDAMSDSTWMDRLSKFGLCNATYENIIKQEFDTIIDYANPWDVHYCYRNSTGNVTGFKSRRETLLFDYYPTGEVKEKMIQKRHETYKYSYDKKGELIAVDGTGSSKHFIKTFSGDTVFVRYYNPLDEVYKTEGRVGDSLVINKLVRRQFFIDEHDWCGRAFQYVGWDSFTVSKLEEKDADRCYIRIKTFMYDDVYQLTEFYRFPDRDSVSETTVNKENDTIKWVSTVSEEYDFFQFVETERIEIDYPNSPELYRRAEVTFSDEGYTENRKYYNYNGDLFEIDYYSFGGTCGVPSIEKEHLIPRNKNGTGQLTKIADVLKNHSKYTFQKYNFLNDPYMQKFHFVAHSGMELPAEDTDVLLIDNKTFSIKQWKDSLLLFLLDNNIKPNKSRQTYTINYSVDRGWSIYGSHRKKHDRFVKIFEEFSAQYHFTAFRPEEERGVLVSKKGASDLFLPYEIKGIKWSLQW